MANYYGTTRSNYFLVKDEDAFKKEMSKYSVEIVTKTIGEETGYGILDANQDGGGIDWSFYDEEADDFIDIDWIEILSKHLRDGQVGILMESGAEKYRYITGWATAFNNKGESRSINLQEIYTLAKELGDGITTAEY